MNLRCQNRRGNYLIPGKHRSSHRWRFAHEKPEIEARFLQSAGGGGKREAARNIFRWYGGSHAAEIGVADSARIGRAMRSGITVATTAINWHERRFGHARQSRSTFSVSICREVGSKP